MIVLALLLGAVLALPFWMVRWALAWRLAVIYGLAVVSAQVLAAPVGWQSRGAGYDLVRLSAMFLAGAVMLGFVTRAIWQVWRRPRIGWAPRWIDWAMAAWVGVLASLVSMVALGWHMVGEPVLPSHLVALTAGVVPLVLVFLFRWPVLRIGFLSLSLSLIALTLISAFAYPRIVLASAARIAGGDHCLSLPVTRAPATSVGQLTFLTMDKMPAWFALPHVTLVSEEGPVAHWSYHLTRFTPQAVIPPVTYCQPEGQAGVSPETRETLASIWVNKAEFRVPLAYAPFAGGPDTLAVSMDAPEMTPASDPDFATAWLGVGLGDSVAHLVPKGAAFSPAEHGLERLDLDPMLEVYVDRVGDIIVAQIECWDVTCLHRFSPNGADRIILDYDRDLLPLWRDMQERATRRFDSFRG